MHRLAQPLSLALTLTLTAPAAAQEYASHCLPGRDAADAVSFAVDPAGVAHVVRVYRFTGGIEYVRVDPTGAESAIQIAPFISQIADDEVIDTDVVLEDARPWACYYNAARDRFEVARLNGAAWTAEVVGEGRGLGRWCSLAWRDGAPTVAFGSDDGALRIAHRAGPADWRVQVIDAPPGLAVGREIDLAWIDGLGWFAAHRTDDDTLRVTWQDAGIWRSAAPLLPAGPTGASPRVVDAGDARVFVVHGGPASDNATDAGLFLSQGDPAALDTFTLQQEGIGGSLGAVRRGDHLLVAVREKQRSALFGNADALGLWADFARAPAVVDLARNGPLDTRHVYRDVDLALDAYGQPVVLTSDLTEVAAGQPDGAEVCLHRRVDADGDGIPDAAAAVWHVPASAAFAEPLRYGAIGCTPAAEPLGDAPTWRFDGAPRAGCQFTGAAVEPDALYAIDFAARVDSGSLTAWPGLGVSNTSALGRTFSYAADGLWHRERLVVPIPADNQGDLRAIFSMNGEGEVADVRVSRIDPALVPGGAFEFADLRGWRPYGPTGCSHDPDGGVFDGGAALRCDPDQKQQVTGIALPGGRYLLTGAAMIESGSAVVRVGDRDSNVDLDRALGLYPKSGWQTFARIIDLPHDTPDLRIVLSSFGAARFDAVALSPLRSATALVGGDMELPEQVWINRNAGRCRLALTDRLEGAQALACVGLVEARQSRVPLRAGQLYRLSALVECPEGSSCRGDVEFNGGGRIYGSTLADAPEIAPYALTFRVPTGITSADLRFSVRGAALIDAITLEPLGAGASLLVNGSFEAPLAVGWRRYGRAGCVVAPTDAWDGAAALSCADEAIQQLGIPALGGARYRLSWRRRGAGAVEVRIGDRTSNADSFGGASLQSGAGAAWITEDRHFTAPPAGSDDLRIVFATSGPVEIDAVELTAAAADGALIPEGDFDDGSLGAFVGYGATPCEASADAAFSGGAGARCSAAGMQRLDLPLGAGRTYRLRYAWRVDSGVLSVRVGLGTSNVDFEGGGLSSGRTAAWAERERIFTVPADFAGDARLVVHSTGDARIDAIRLVEVE